MRIDVVGGGALGLLFGAMLAEAGVDITIWTRSQEQAVLLAERGIRLLELGGEAEKIIPVKSSWIGHASSAARPDLSNSDKIIDRWVWLTVKQTDINDELLARLHALTSGTEAERTAVVCLQNGIGHLERLERALSQAPLYAAVTTEGAKRLDSRTVEHTGKGQLWLGDWNASNHNSYEYLGPSQEMLVNMLQSAGFSSFLSKDLKNRIFNKLLINAVINPLTAIFNVTNGELSKDPLREKLMRALYSETEKILVTSGMNMPKDGWQLIIDVCEQTSRNISSMLSDVRAGRITEIDAINGGVATLAEKRGMQAPLNRAIAELVQALHPKLT